MSLVGPRPEIPFYVNDFKDKIPMYMIKHQVKPGITGLAQVNGYRGDTSIEKRIEYDIRYIENWSFFLDIGILIRTALSGFMNKEKLNPDKPGSKKYIKPYRPEKTNMKKTEGKTDLLALVMFLPSVIALALIPIIINIQTVVTDLQQTYMVQRRHRCKRRFRHHLPAYRLLLAGEGSCGSRACDDNDRNGAGMLPVAVQAR